jgi:hypothetical protein
VIVVKVELHSAITGEITEIGRTIIYNDGSGDALTGNYGVRVMRKGTTETIQREARVEKHARQSLPIWVLIRRALEAAGF